MSLQAVALAGECDRRSGDSLTSSSHALHDSVCEAVTVEHSGEEAVGGGFLQLCDGSLTSCHCSPG